MSLQGCIPDQDSGAKGYLEALEKKFAKSKKAEVSALFVKLATLKYKGQKGIREHITEMVNLQCALKPHRVNISDELLIEFIFLSLPKSFSHFQMTYNCMKEDWTLAEFETQLVQEEERQKTNKVEEANVVTSGSKRKGKKRNNKTPTKATQDDAKKHKKEGTFEKSEEKFE